MAAGLSVSVANGFLNALGNATNYTAPAALWVKLHIGEPGAAGTSNVAAETRRMQASFGTASSGVMSNDSVLTWTGVAGTEDYTHWSAWDASSGGNFLCSGVITANAVTAGQTFSILVGGLGLSFAVAS